MLLLCGCNGEFTKYGNLRGLDPQLNSTDIALYTQQESAAIQSLATLAFPADHTVPATGSPDWYFVVLAGADYIDQKCDSYINALFWFNRWKNSAKSTVALTGAATATAMGLFKSSTEALSLTATAFGLATGLIDVGSNDVLYSIDPTALRLILQKAQAAYRDGLATSRAEYNNQASAVQAIQGYLGLCLPAGLDALVNNSVATSTVQLAHGTAGNPVPQITVNGGTPPSPPPRTTKTFVIPAPIQVLPADVAGKKAALERFVRTLALQVAAGTVPKSQLDDIAHVVGAPISTSVPEERSAILAFVGALVNSSDPVIAASQWADLSTKLAAAGIHPTF